MGEPGGDSLRRADEVADGGVGLAGIHSSGRGRGVGALPGGFGADAAITLGAMFGHFRLAFSYPVDFYLLVLALIVFCAIEPSLATLWAQVEEALTARGSGMLVHSYVLRPAMYACGLLLFLMFNDRSTQFIYFQF